MEKKFNLNFLKSYITFGEFETNSVLNNIYIPEPHELESASKKNSKKEYIIDNKKLIVKMYSKRYLTFLESTICYICGLQGSFFLLQQRNIKDKVTPENSAHFNLYAKDILNKNNGNIILMTVDHFIPISKGGKNFKENLKTCCHFCNVSKGDSIK